MLQGCPVTCENRGSPSVSCSNPTTSPRLPQQNTSQLGNSSMKPGKLRSRFLRALFSSEATTRIKFLGFYSRGLCVPTSNFWIKRGRKFVTSRKTWALYAGWNAQPSNCSQNFLAMSLGAFSWKNCCHRQATVLFMPRERKRTRQGACFFPSSSLSCAPKIFTKSADRKNTNVTQVQSNYSTLSYSAAQLSSNLLSGWTKVRISEVFQLNFRR